MAPIGALDLGDRGDVASSECVRSGGEECQDDASNEQRCGGAPAQARGSHIELACRVQHRQESATSRVEKCNGLGMEEVLVGFQNAECRLRSVNPSSGQQRCRAGTCY